jgi:hypothetical protein
MPRRLTAAQFVAIDRRVSPDDVKFKMLERDRLAATDTRTPAQVWLGEPPPWRSALTQSKHQSPTGARAPVDQAHPTKKTGITPVPVETLSKLAEVGRLTIGQRKRIARELVDGGMSRHKIAEALRLSPSTVKNTR